MIVIALVEQFHNLYRLNQQILRIVLILYSPVKFFKERRVPFDILGLIGNVGHWDFSCPRRVREKEFCTVVGKASFRPGNEDAVCPLARSPR